MSELTWQETSQLQGVAATGESERGKKERKKEREEEKKMEREGRDNTSVGHGHCDYSRRNKEETAMPIYIQVVYWN